MNERQYPIVSIVARDLLLYLIPIVASESGFSARDEILTDHISRL